MPQGQSDYFLLYPAMLFGISINKILLEEKFCIELIAAREVSGRVTLSERRKGRTEDITEHKIRRNSYTNS